MTLSSNQINPKVSIIIPVFNGSNYMREAIDSALAQTYNNIEIIVVNDGSNDHGATREIALSYGDRLKYLEKENGGVASALNTGIREMTGDYFSWLSHDDVYYTNKIEKQIITIKELKNKETIIYSNFDTINHKSDYLRTTNFEDTHIVNRLNSPLYPIFHGLLHGCTMLIPKSCFSLGGSFNETLKTTQDYDLWFKFLKRFEIHFVKDSLIKSRIHEEQESKRNVNKMHETEGNDLWIYMMNNVTESEILSFQDTRIKFYKDISDLLKHTLYKQACKYANKKYCEYLNSIDINQIKVSIIIPFYNRVNLLQNAIKSAQDQTFKNTEIVIVNDGSIENIDHLKAIWKPDKRIKYFDQENLGPASARNLGLKNSSGDFIAFLDSDDIYFDDKIEIQLKETIKSGCLFSYTTYYQVKDNDIISLIDSKITNADRIPGIISNCPLATPTIMISRRVIDEGFKFPSRMRIGEDVCLWISIAKKYYVLKINKPLTRVNIGSENTWNNYDKRILGISNIINFILNDHELLNHSKQLSELHQIIADSYRAKHELEYIVQDKSSNRVITKKIKEDKIFYFVKLFINNRYTGYVILNILFPIASLFYSIIKTTKKALKLGS